MVRRLRDGLMLGTIRKSSRVPLPRVLASRSCTCHVSSYATGQQAQDRQTDRQTERDEVKPVKPISQLRFECDTTKTRLRRKIDIARVESRRMEAGACDTS